MNNWDRPVSNIQYCASLEDALSRCNRPNTENVFFHQDLPIFYRIKVDFDGKKYWQDFMYSSNQIDNTPVVKQDLKCFEDRLNAIENILFRKESEIDEQSNG